MIDRPREITVCLISEHYGFALHDQEPGYIMLAEMENDKAVELMKVSIADYLAGARMLRDLLRTTNAVTEEEPKKPN